MRRNQLALICAVLALFGCAKKPKVAVKAKPPKPGWTETGIASWYGYPYHGRRAANGEIYDMEKMTAAHRTLPFGAMVRVINQNNNRSVEVRITDRGPFVDGRVIDLSKAAARQIELIGPGVAKVKLVLLGYSEKTPPMPAPPPVVLVKAKKPLPPPVAPVPAAPPLTPAAPAPDPSMPDEAAVASNPTSNPAPNSSQTLEPPAPDAEAASTATTPVTGTPVPPASPAAPPASASPTTSPVTPTPSAPAGTLPASSAPVVPAPVTEPRVPAVSPAPIADPLENGQFAVQVGAFRDRARAEQLQRSLSTRYAPVQLIPRDAGYTVWRVLVGRKNSLEEANALAGVLKPVTGAAFVVRLDQ